MDLMPVYAKAELSIVPKSFGNCMDINEVQSENAPFDMVLTVCGIFTLISFLQFLKELSPIDFKSLGRRHILILEFMKASLGNSFSLLL